MSEIFEIAKEITRVYAEGLRQGQRLSGKVYRISDVINLDLLEEDLKKQGWTSTATDYVIEAVKEKMAKEK